MANRGGTFIREVVLVSEECCNCGVLFAMPDDMKQRRKDDHQTFWCPNGHGQHYTAKSDAEKLQDKLDQEKQRTAALLAEKDQVEASLRATKGQLTKAKRRAANGVCPCCKRTFKDLARHVAGQHPQYVAETAI